MSAGFNTRRQKTDTAENSASAFSEPLRPLVSWKLPRPSMVVAGWPTNANTGTRLAKDSPRPGMRFSAPPPGGRGHYPKPAPLRLYPSAIVAAENSCLANTALMSRTEVCGIVKIFDVGAVDAEYVLDVGSREVFDDVVDYPVLPGHLLT